MANGPQDDRAAQSELDRDPVEQLAEEFLQRRRKGDSVSISEYADGHPHLAQRIADLFPMLLLMEEMKPVASLRSGDLAPPQANPGLRRLGDFRILREIGRGGMGVVYEAHEESLGRHVALKVLPAVCTASPNRLQRFLREAQAAARLHHTNIVPIFGVGQEDEIHYYVMQYIAGQGLDSVLGALSHETAGSAPKPGEDGAVSAPNDASGGLSASQAAHMLLTDSVHFDGTAPDSRAAESQETRPAAVPAALDARYWRSVARIGVQVAEALEYAHQQGILHRDIKPANLLLDNRGTVWITDFGLAKLADVDDLTHSGDTVGTLRYMAPERFAGQADARSDVYGLGLTLYELLALRPGFDERDRGRLVRQVTQEEPPRLRSLNAAVPRDLETIIVKAIASHADQRYQTAGELAEDLRCFLEDRPVRARRATLAGRGWRWCRRNRAVAALSGTALALLLAVAVVATLGYFHTSQALRHAEAARRQAETAQAQAETARQQAEVGRAQTRAQRERAEANLRLATRAFEDIFSKVATHPVAQAGEEEEEEDWAQTAWQAGLSHKDAALLESMLRFYDQFAQQNQADVKLQKESARAYRRVGEIQRRLGQYAKAETAYRHALATYQRLAEDSGQSGDEATAIAAIHNELGVLLRNTGRVAEARDAHVQARETLNQLSPKLAAAPEGRFELARTYAHLSTMPLGPMPAGPAGPIGPGSPGRRGSRPSSSRGHEPTENNRKALKILEELTADEPGNPRYRLALAGIQRDRYFLLAYTGRRDEAGQAKQAAIGILEKLIAEVPQNPDYRCELADTFALTYLPSRDGKLPESVRPQVQRAVEIAGELVARYPTVPAYKVVLARSHSRLATILRPEAAAQAEEHLQKAVDLERSLATEFAAVPSYGFTLARLLQQLAEFQTARRAWPQARATLEEAVANAEKLQASSADTRPARMVLGMHYFALAKVLKESGEKALADEAAAKANELGGWHHRYHRGPGSARD